MNPSRALAQHRMTRARTALREGDLLIEQRHFNGALNRVYYAAFYAARALLATRQLDSSRHSGVIALFQEHFVRTGLIPTDTARALPRTFEKRQTAAVSACVGVVRKLRADAGAVSRSGRKPDTTYGAHLRSPRFTASFGGQPSREL